MAVSKDAREFSLRNDARLDANLIIISTVIAQLGEHEIVITSLNLSFFNN